MWKYKYVKGKEIKTYQDIVDSYHGFIIEDTINQGAYDRSLLLTKDKQISMERLNDILGQDAKVYARVKQYREPIFNNKIDEALETILTDFAYSYSYSEGNFDNNGLIDETLKKIKSQLNYKS